MSKFIEITQNNLNELKNKAKNSSRYRARINIHKTLASPIHEMFIIHQKGAYIRPHKHLNKSESLNIIEGEAKIVFFKDSGKVQKIINMGAYQSGKVFYYKLDEPIFHSMIIESDYLVFQETGNGPFDKNDKIDAPWSPPEKDKQKISVYLKKLIQEVNSFK